MISLQHLHALKKEVVQLNRRSSARVDHVLDNTNAASAMVRYILPATYSSSQAKHIKDGQQAQGPCNPAVGVIPYYTGCKSQDTGGQATCQTGVTARYMFARTAKRRYVAVQHATCVPFAPMVGQPHARGYTQQGRPLGCPGGV